MSNTQKIANPFLTHCLGGAADGADLPSQEEPDIGQILQIKLRHGIVADPNGQRIAERTWTTHLYKYQGNSTATPLSN